jgi:hypothetical protein
MLLQRDRCKRNPKYEIIAARDHWRLLLCTSVLIVPTAQCRWSLGALSMECQSKAPNQSSWFSCSVSTCHDRDRLPPLSERSPPLSKGIPQGDDASSCLSLLGCQSTLARFTPSDSLQRHCHCALRPRCLFGHNRLSDEFPRRIFC